jgi:hypothetical protein
MEELHKVYKKNECKYLTHDFHPYPHKIIPQIARALIKKYTAQNDTILDIFCGSGTSLVEANLLGRNVMGVDVNPLACLISRAKTTSLDCNKLDQAVTDLIKKIQFHLTRDGTLQDYTERLQPKIQCFKERDKWFSKNALLGLSVIKDLIKRIDDSEIRDYCMVAFSCIIKEVSQASPLYHLTKVRYPRQITLFRVNNLFKCKLQEMVREMHEYSKKRSNSFVKVLNQDARTINADKVMGEVDFVILNLPKFNMDFERCFKIYSWWLDFDVTTINKNIIGTMKRKQNYYKDIGFVLGKALDVLKTQKYCTLLVTDSYCAGRHLQHGDQIQQIAKKIGFTFKEKVVRTIPKKLLPFVTKDRKEEIFIFKKL